MTDPARATVLVDVGFSALRDGHRTTLYAIYDPALSNTRKRRLGPHRRHALSSRPTAGSASAFVGSPAFTATSSGFRGTSDGWTDLLADGRMDWRYTSASAGQPRADRGDRTHRAARPPARDPRARLRRRRRHARSPAPAPRCGRGFGDVARAYARGWHALPARPEAARRPRCAAATERQLYRVSAMVLAASEDKTHRGAYVAAPNMPWAWAATTRPGPYHLVWSRDLYQIATALIAAGDTGRRQPRAGLPVHRAAEARRFVPAELARRRHAGLGRAAARRGRLPDRPGLPAAAHRRRDLEPRQARGGLPARLLAGRQPRRRGRPQERWENQSGYSPATIASEIAGLVCAAYIARANGDTASAQRYLATADDWQARVKDWTVTTNGPYSAGPYFLRLTKDGNPNAGTTYNIGDSGPSNVDQRRVVDPSFLDLVRLGVLPAERPGRASTRCAWSTRSSASRPPRGFFWHRASFDGYGEKADGGQWELRPARTTRSSPAAGRGRCSTASAASTRSPPATSPPPGRS